MSTNLDWLENFMAKTAAAKAAADPISEPSGLVGTKHPIAHVDDGLSRPHKGEHYHELSATLEAQTSQSVDSTAEAKPGADLQGRQSLNIGLHPEGSDAGPPDGQPKGTKHDPGTTSVMTADDGRKYAAYLAMPVPVLAAKVAAMRDQLLVRLAADTPVAAANPPAGVAASAAEGYKLAAALGDPDAVERSKRAAAMIESTVTEAHARASLVVDYLRKYASDPDEAADGVDHDPAMGGDPEMGGGGPMGGDPGMGGPMPPRDPAAGGMPPGGAPGMGGGGATPDETIHELASALLEMNIDPAQLAAVAEEIKQQQQQPGGDPAQVAKAAALSYAAEAVFDYKRTGRFGFGPPKSARLQSLRADLRNHIAELVGFPR